MSYLDKVLDLFYSESFSTQLSTLKILLVGAGGIGCEILKHLCKFKFASIHIVDLDTIEVSNLNRQFLFRKEHKGLSKAIVAKETLLKLNPDLNLVAFQSNIKEFGIKYFKQFHLILSALDNQEARSYINSMCVALNKPLFDAGTTGYKGQAMILKKGISRCYDCEEKAKSKTYQVCTIRTLPEKPLHCIIWGKYLFGILFGNNDDDNLLEDLREKIYRIEENADFAKIIFEEIFEKQIEKQINSDPDKFSYLKVLKLNEIKLDDNNGNGINQNLLNENIYSIDKYCKIFIKSTIELYENKKKAGFLEFEKDDDLIIRFISSAANLRCHIFSLPLQTDYNVKEIAGNIIPAICSTNSIVASIELIEALKFVSKKSKNKECYVQNDRIKKINSINPLKANPKCLVCNDELIPTLLYVNFHEFQLKNFINVLKREREFNNLTINQENLIIYEQYEYLDEDEIEFNSKKLDKTIFEIFSKEFDIKITVTLEDSNELLKLILVHNEILKNNNFEIENDYLQKKNTTNLKNIMIDNKIDYNEQEKILKNIQEKKLTSIKEGFYQISDDENENEISLLETNPEKKNLKRVFNSILK